MSRCKIRPGPHISLRQVHPDMPRASGRNSDGACKQATAKRQAHLVATELQSVRELISTNKICTCCGAMQGFKAAMRGVVILVAGTTSYGMRSTHACRLHMCDSYKGRTRGISANGVLVRDLESGAHVTSHDRMWVSKAGSCDCTG